jgi:hypothetical protein
MRSWVRCLCLSLAAAGAVITLGDFSAAGAQGTQALRSFNSPLGYSVSFPSAWTAGTPNTSTNPNIKSDLNYQSPDFQSFIFAVVDTSGLLDPLTLLNSYAADPPANDWGYVASTPSVRSVPGAQSAYIMSASSTYKGDTPWNDYDLVASAPRGLYQLHVAQTASYAAAHQSELSAILNSFQIGATNPSGPSNAAPSGAPQLVSPPLSNTITTAPPPQPQPTNPPARSNGIQRNGAGDSQIGTVVNSTGALRVCVQASGSSPTGLFGPDATLFIEMAPSSPGFDFQNIDMVGNPGCQTVSLQSGTYTASVVATDWTKWSVTITPS